MHKIRKYFQGIGVDTKHARDKFKAGVWGTGCEKQIYEVYQVSIAWYCLQIIY